MKRFLKDKNKGLLLYRQKMGNSDQSGGIVWVNRSKNRPLITIRFRMRNRKKNSHAAEEKKEWKFIWNIPITDYEHPMKPFFIAIQIFLGLGRQTGQINSGAFSAKLSAPILVLWVLGY